MTQIQSIQCGAEEYDVNDVRDGALYSTCEFAGLGAQLPTELPMFNYTVGQPVTRSPTIARRTADARDTNMPRRSFITSDQQIFIALMWPEIFALTPDTTIDSPGTNDQAIVPLPSGRSLKWMNFSSILKLVIGVGTRKPYFDAPFGYWPALTDAQYVTCGDSPGGPEVSLGSQGLSGGRMARVTDRYIHVDSNDKIQAVLEFPAGPTPLAAGTNSVAMTLPQSLRVRVYVKGLRFLPVQGGAA